MSNTYYQPTYGTCGRDRRLRDRGEAIESKLTARGFIGRRRVLCQLLDDLLRECEIKSRYHFADRCFRPHVLSSRPGHRAIYCTRSLRWAV